MKKRVAFLTTIMMFSLFWGVTSQGESRRELSQSSPQESQKSQELVTLEDFLKEAQDISKELKSSLVSALSQKIATDGAIKAIPFCHENVKLLAKTSVGSRLSRYEFGRTSHRIRNASNAPQEWMKPYIEMFKNKKKTEVSKKYVIHHFKDSKRAYLEPLFVGPKCLLCHGDKVSSEIKKELKVYYPKDQATGFKLGDFRGLIWVKEK